MRIFQMICHSKPIPGFEGIYEAHDDGTIWTAKNKTTFRLINGKRQPRIWKQKKLQPKLEQRKNSIYSDERVELWKNGQHKTYLVHRLVASAFVPNPLNKPCVNHKDGNPLNNRPTNLEWCTYSENQIHAFKNRLNKEAIPVQLISFDQKYQFFSLSEASKFIGKNSGYISGKLKKGIKNVKDKNGREFYIKTLVS